MHCAYMAFVTSVWSTQKAESVTACTGRFFCAFLSFVPIWKSPAGTKTCVIPSADERRVATGVTGMSAPQS